MCLRCCVHAENEIVYLDSRELAMRLRLRFETGTSKRAGQDNPHALLEVSGCYQCSRES